MQKYEKLSVKSIPNSDESMNNGQTGNEVLDTISAIEAIEPLIGNKKVSVELPGPLAKLIKRLSDRDLPLLFLLLQENVFKNLQELFLYPVTTQEEFRKVFHEYLDSVTDSAPDFDNESANFLIKVDNLFYSIYESTLFAYVALVRSQRREVGHEK